jgi:N-alpha-acetyltransferase 15/16, NatA auxiliary subunit
LLTKHAVTQPANASEDKGIEPGPTKDDDPDGVKLLQATDPLERAAKFLGPLAVHAQANILTWIAIYDVAVRRSKSFYTHNPLLLN